ncbi:hypothetical protein FOA52_014651 [Chlamydomonas sp. UWO 241]|nr:hypothetical protein FOA52_014651 [Chlamydomonas sp. UWO 241]
MLRALLTRSYAAPRPVASAQNSTSTSTSSGDAASRAAAAGKVRKTGKLRLDDLVCSLYPQYSKRLVQSWILQGKVVVQDRVVDKAGTPVSPTAKVIVNAVEQRFVCRAGFKLEKALAHFGVDVTGKACLDSGQSTGGFTDCLLQSGAARVFGVDVGYGQLHEKVRVDPRVTVIERCNLRYMTRDTLGGALVDIACLDLSFISVLKVIPAVMGVLKPDVGAELVVLIKPQFEAGREQVESGGVVRDPKVHEMVIERVSAGIEAWGFRRGGVTESPIRGEKSGNTEFLAYFVRDPSVPITADTSTMAVPGQEEAGGDEGRAARGAPGSPRGRGRDGEAGGSGGPC